MGACEHGNISIVKTLLGNPECDATIEDNVSKAAGNSSSLIFR